MRIMADIPAVLLETKKRVKDVADGIQPAGNRNRQEKHRNPNPRKKQNGGKNDSTNATGCPIRAILVIPVDVEGQQIATDDRAKINREKLQLSQVHFEPTAKEIEAHHVENEMIPIGMEEGRRNQ